MARLRDYLCDSSPRRLTTVAALGVAALGLSACGDNHSQTSQQLVVTTPSGTATTESGGQVRFGVSLSAKPSGDVKVPVASNDPTEGQPGVSSLTFTPENYAAPQIVTVTGQDDPLIDGTVAYKILLGPADGGGISGATGEVALTNTDNDSGGVTLSPALGSVTEEGGQTTFTVVLNAQPTADVTVTLASRDATEGSIDPTTVLFTKDNWNAPRTVTVTGLDDDLQDGPQTFKIGVTGITSSDPKYTDVEMPEDISVVCIDNDTAGFIVSTISGPTSETGDSATFSIRLTTQPTADVVVHFASSDTTEGVTTASELTFTAANWNAPQDVTVVGQNDDVADGNQTYNIAFSATTSTDAAYAAIMPTDVAAANLDDETPGIVVNPGSPTTGEDGSSATFTVQLQSQPTADVTIDYATSDASEGIATGVSLTFTPANWNAPQTITVNGQDDQVADGNQPYHIAFAASGSADPNYVGLVAPQVPLTNVDNDTAGITVSAISGDTTEAGVQATFTVVLNSEPTADVTVNFATDDASEGVTNITSLTFTPANYLSPQTVTVTGINDDVADGNQPYQIDFAATNSADPAYAAITPASVDVVNTDNDSAGITVSAISADTTEAGGQATFTIVLNSEPTADVTVNFGSDDVGEGTPDLTSITFNSANWSVARTVTLTGINDNIADGNQPYQIDFTATTSADPAYAAITPNSVDVINTDDDTAAINVSTISGDTTEAGGTASFGISLNSEPTSNVTVNFNSSNTTEGTVNPTSVTFTPADWQVIQFVTVTGVDDAIADSSQPYRIDFTATTSGDPAYAAITPASINLSNLDNDSAGITVSAASGNTTEAGVTASFTVVLTSQPVANVTVNYNSNDLTEGTVSPASLTFTAANWNVAQTVTITGVDDVLFDGNISYGVAFTATTSADPIYAAITPATVTLQNIDNDVGTCGNNILEAGEERDPPPGPFTNMQVNSLTCKWNMQSVAQLYCNGTCSWAGVSHCDQADADLFCRLRTGNPLSTATSFQMTTALALPGFSCAPLGYGTSIGTLPLRGVNVDVRYQDTSILANHGAGTVITNPVCTNP